MRDASFCPECGATLEGDAEFCTACGADVEPGKRTYAEAQGAAAGEPGDPGADAPRESFVIGGYVLGALGLLFWPVGIVGIVLAYGAKRAGNPDGRKALVVAVVLTVAGIAISLALFAYCQTIPGADPGLCEPFEGIGS